MLEIAQETPLVWWHSVQDAVAAVSAQLLEGIGPFSSEHLREIRWSEKVHYRSMGVGRSTYRVGVQWQQGSEGAEGVRVIEFGGGELLFAAPLNDGDAFLCAHPGRPGWCGGYAREREPIRVAAPPSPARWSGWPLSGLRPPRLLVGPGSPRR